jgi:integrase
MEMFADKYITEIGAKECQDWIVARTGSIIGPGLRNAGKPRSDDAVTVECWTLKAIFAKAIEEKVYTGANPWNKKSGPGRTPRESVLSNAKGKHGEDSDQDRLFKELAHPKRTDGWRKVGGGIEALRAVQLILGSGLRMSEFRRLRPCDVVKDGPGGPGWVIDVYRGKGGKARGPRTGKNSRKARYIPIQSATLAVLEAQRERRGLDQDARQPYWKFEASWLGKYLTRACKAAGVVVLIEPEDGSADPEVRGGITPHDLRRTYATRLALSGKVPPKMLQDLMGHASYEITMRHYQGFGDAQTSVVQAVDLGL